MICMLMDIVVVGLVDWLCVFVRWVDLVDGLVVILTI